MADLTQQQSWKLASSVWQICTMSMENSSFPPTLKPSAIIMLFMQLRFDNKKSSENNPVMLIGALLVAFIMISLLYWFFQPYWETNDDVGMSMVAHGYGIAAVATPQLVFSNVL